MSSPFPGMDPYLEGALWPDVHQKLASRFQKQLDSRIRGKNYAHYVVWLHVRDVEDVDAHLERGITYSAKSKESQVSLPPAERPLPPGCVPPALYVPCDYVTVRLVTVLIRDIRTNETVTAIETLAPVNKHGMGFRTFRRRRKSFLAKGVNLLEIDLLRRGKRIFPGRLVHEADYLAMLTQVGENCTHLWPFDMHEKLPVLPVPLRKNDGSVPLDIGEALSACYESAAYDLSIDYSQPPPPPELSPEDAAWAREVTSK